MMQYYASSMYMLELEIESEDVQSGYHSGACDDDIDALRDKPYIAEQLAKIDPDKLRLELKEYGAWDAAELADHEANLRRFLWLACGDIQDNNV